MFCRWPDGSRYAPALLSLTLEVAAFAYVLDDGTALYARNARELAGRVRSLTGASAEE